MVMYIMFCMTAYLYLYIYICTNTYSIFKCLLKYTTLFGTTSSNMSSLQTLNPKGFVLLHKYHGAIPFPTGLKHQSFRRRGKQLPSTPPSRAPARSRLKKHRLDSCRSSSTVHHISSLFITCHHISSTFNQHFITLHHVSSPKKHFHSLNLMNLLRVRGDLGHLWFLII